MFKKACLRQHFLQDFLYPGSQTWYKDYSPSLIDTGADRHANERTSVIGDVLPGNGHADDMTDTIVSQNPDARILSIRAI